MRAMILAAGRGERLRPLTDLCPKPLIQVAGKPLIVYHLENLHAAGITDIVINLGHLGEQIFAALGQGEAWDVKITYSWESPILEVGGGIFKALPLLGEEPFMIVNGDIWTDYPLSELPHHPNGLAHLVLVNNPAHNLKGDFAINEQGRLCNQSFNTYTYSGVSVLHPALFAGCPANVAFRLRPLLDKALENQQLMGEYYRGQWTDVGTLERLDQLQQMLLTSTKSKAID